MHFCETMWWLHDIYDRSITHKEMWNLYEEEIIPDDDGMHDGYIRLCIRLRKNR